MKTDDLIAVLSTNVEPVDHRQMSKTIRNALLAAGAAVTIAVLATLGLRHDAFEFDALAALAIKLAFTLLLLIVAAHYLIKLARPGGERRVSMAWLIVPFLGLMGLSAVTLALSPPTHWKGLILDDQWLECIVSIPIIAIVPFAVIVWAVRQTAPTDLPRAGAVAGLVAGCLSAAGYALHCTGDNVPFVTIWYGGTIALCTLIGWKLGPRLLRW